MIDRNLFAGNTWCHFGIEALRLKSVSGAVEARRAMLSMHNLVRARLRKLVVAGKTATRKHFVRAVKAAVAEARASKPNLVPWRYFAKIEKPGRQEVLYFYFYLCLFVFVVFVLFFVSSH